MNVDHEEIKRWQKSMCDARRHLRDSVKAVGHARQVIEFDSDRRKQLLARYTSAYLAKGEGKISVASAEVHARADKNYAKQLSDLADQLEDAFTTRADWEATQAKLEAARSLHSVARDVIRSQPE